MPDMSDDTDTGASQSMQRPSHSIPSKELELPKTPPKTVPGQPCLQTYRLPSRAPLASPTSRAQSPSMSTKSLLPETLSPTFRGRTAIPPTVTGAEARILTLLEKLMAKVDNVDHKINQVLMCLDTDALKEEVPLPEGVVLPVSTMEELNVLEDFIKEPSNRKSLVRKLSTIGGVNLQNDVRKTLKETLSDQIFLQFNWLERSYVEGMQGKRAFSTLNLKLVIYKALRLNKDFENESDSNIKKWIKEWLRGASHRNGGRRRRASAQASAITAATADPDEAVEQPRG